MRLDKYLSNYGLGTRSEVKEFLKKGRVCVDGNICRQAELQIDPEVNRILFDGEALGFKGEFSYYLLYKPAGYLTATEDEKRPVVTDLIPDKRKGLSPVGRLDLDTEGALLITDDGELSHRLISPKYHVEKTYYAELSEALPENSKELFSAPMIFKEFTARPAEKFERITENSANLTITEGKYHQVKRMFERIGCPVTYLKRVSFGPLTLTGLEKGEVRALSAEEIRELKRLTGLLS